MPQSWSGNGKNLFIVLMLHVQNNMLHGLKFILMKSGHIVMIDFHSLGMFFLFLLRFRLITFLTSQASFSKFLN